MKNIIIITALACTTCLLSACGGDRVPQNGKGDTVDSKYGKLGGTGQADTAIDTGRDNSASGGTKTDTTKMDSVKKR